MKKRKRIVYVVGTLGLGGVERMTTDLSLALQHSKEWQVMICCLMGKIGPFVNVLETEGVRIDVCSLTQRNLISFPFRFAHLLRDLQPDILHSHVSSSMPWQILGARLAGVKRIIFTQHSEYRNWNASLFARLRIWLYYAVCSPFIFRHTVVSQAVQRHLAEIVIRSADDFEIIHNPVNTDSFCPAPSIRDYARRQLGLEEDIFLVGSVARLAPPKAHLQILEAAKQVVQKDSSVRFVFVGDGPLRAAVEARIHELDLDHHIILAGPRTDVNLLYPAFDVFILPSIREGFPLALVEAMASGLPVIASDLGGIAEAMGEETGTRIPPGDSNSLATAISRLKCDPVLRNEFSRRARLRAVECFSLPVILGKYLNVYRSALAE
ncbi:MAG TPA: glycosyltransferase [Anaerolineales bacterium]|nr:glycosyltransferase [Anaerolineales bacterium]